MKTTNASMTVDQGIDALMAILNGAPVSKKAQEKNQQQQKSEVTTIRTSHGRTVQASKECVWENGQLVEVDGKKMTTGYVARRGGSKGRTAKDDAGKKALQDIYIPLIQNSCEYGKVSFIHNTEGLIVRMPEADYSIKITKSKENKYDPAEEDFEVEKDFSVRGKTKNSAPALAKFILAAVEREFDQTADWKFELISARASGIICHLNHSEYTIKISKKRDRVGFQAEKGSAYEK